MSILDIIMIIVLAIMGVVVVKLLVDIKILKFRVKWHKKSHTQQEHGLRIS